MIKAIQTSVAVSSVGTNQLLVILAVGEDGFVYQMVNGRWFQMPALDNVIEQPQPKNRADSAS